MSNVFPLNVARGERFRAARERAREPAVPLIDEAEAETSALAAKFQTVHRHGGAAAVDIMAQSFGRFVSGALVRAFGKSTAKRFARTVIETIRAEVEV